MSNQRKKKHQIRTLRNNTKMKSNKVKQIQTKPYRSKMASILENKQEEKGERKGGRWIGGHYFSNQEVQN